MSKLFVEFTLSDSWDAYIPDDKEKLKALVNRDSSVVQTKIITDEQIKKVPEMIDALKTLLQCYTDECRIPNVKVVHEVKSILKEIKS